MESSTKNMAGKGSKPRSCFSQKFKDNFDNINWKREKDQTTKKESNQK